MPVKRVVIKGLGRLPAFSHATVAGEFVFVSGTLGTEGETLDLAAGGTGPETIQALRNIEKILEACGASFADVTKVNVFLADMTTFPEMNRAYMECLGEDGPARITVGGAVLALGAAVEIDCVAHRARKPDL